MAGRRTNGKATMLPKGVARAPLPDKLPGRYFVLEWTAFSGYKLTVDTPQHSSYALGADIPTVMMRFDAWRHKDIGMRAMDCAKEYGMAQAIFAGSRIIPRGGNIARTRPDVFSFKPQRSSYGTLPALF